MASDHSTKPANISRMLLPICQLSNRWLRATIISASRMNGKKISGPITAVCSPSSRASIQSSSSVLRATEPGRRLTARAAIRVIARACSAGPSSAANRRTVFFG